MSDQTCLAAGAEAVKEIFAALNRGDIPAAVAFFDPEIEWIEPIEYGGGGPKRGRACVEEHLLKARARWAEGACEIERAVVAGDRVVVFVHVHVRLKNEAEWRDGRHAAVYAFRGGQVTQMRIFDDSERALEWVGMAATKAK